MIDEKKLIEDLKYLFRHTPEWGAEHYEQCLKLINKQPTVQPQGIEELPSHAQEIIDDLQERINKSHARYMELEHKCFKQFGYRLEDMLNKQIEQPQGIDKDEINTALQRIALLAMESDETDCYDMELIIRQLVKLGVVGIEDGQYVFEFDEVEGYEVREAKRAITQPQTGWIP